MNRSRTIDRPDQRTADDLRTAVRDLAQAITEPGLGRSERISRARSAADAARNLADAVAILNPYSDGRHSQLRDTIAANITDALGSGGALADDASDRLNMLNTARAVPAGGVTTPGALALGGVSPVRSPLGGTYVNPVEFRESLMVPWLLGMATVSDGPAADQSDLQPEPLEALPTATLNPTTAMTATSFEVTATPVDWTQAAILVAPSRQLLDWAAGALTFENALRIAVLIALETALLDQLTAGLTPAASFEAAEVAVGAAWPAGTGADLVLTSSADLPKVRRLYAAEGLTDPTLRPHIMATAGVTTGTAVVMTTAAVDLQRSEISTWAKHAPSVLGVEAALEVWGAVSLRKKGTVATVSVS